MDPKYDYFAKRDGRTAGQPDRHTGLLGCDGRIQKHFLAVVASVGLSVRLSEVPRKTSLILLSKRVLCRELRD